MSYYTILSYRKAREGRAKRSEKSYGPAKNAATAAALVRGSAMRAPSALLDGRVRLLREDRCDGLSGCLLPSWNVSRPRTGAPPRSACNARGAGRGPTCAIALSASPRPRADPYDAGASSRIAADCAAFAYAGMHEHVGIGVLRPRRLSARAFFAKRGVKLLH